MNQLHDHYQKSGLIPTESLKSEGSCSPLADCDCDTDEDPAPMETHRCAECEEDVEVCLGCYQIRNGCDCGHCQDCTFFIEE